MKTPEEITEELKSLGIDLGSWGDATNGGTAVQLSSLDRQRGALLKLRGALEGLVESDRQTTLRLKEQLARLDHGGGQ